MGTKGDKLTSAAAEICEQVVQALAPLGDIGSRKMFGGYGIFESGAMFALVDSRGELFLKADESNKARFETAGAQQHGKMPYFGVPEGVRQNTALLHEWARESIEIARANKKK